MWIFVHPPPTQFSADCAYQHGNEQVGLSCGVSSLYKARLGINNPWPTETEAAAKLALR